MAVKTASEDLTLQHLLSLGFPVKHIADADYADDLHWSKNEVFH